MAATQTDVLQAMAASREQRLRARSAVRKLMRYFELTDAHLAEAFNISRQAMNYRINGRTVISDDDVAGFAAYFGVPKEVLYLSPDDVIRWVLDHPPNISEPKPSLVNSTRRAA